MRGHKKIISLFSTLLFSSVLVQSSSQVLATPIDDARINDPCDDIIEQAEQNNSDAEADSGENSDARKEIIERASKDFKDAQYTQSSLRLGHYGKYGDCSSFVCMIYAKVLGGTPADYGGYTVGMEKHFEEIKESEAKAGDICFWGKKGGTTHTAIYDGKGGIYEMGAPETDWNYTKPVYRVNGDGGKIWFARLKNEGSTKKAYKKLVAGGDSSSSSSSSDEDNEDNKEESKNETVSSKDLENETFFNPIKSNTLTTSDTHSCTSGCSMRKSVIKKAYNLLHNEYGFSAQGVAGILGNFAKESHGFSYICELGRGDDAATKKEAQEKYMNKEPVINQGGIGLGQWTNTPGSPRASNLIKFAEKKTGSRKNWVEEDLQLQYLFNENNGGYNDALRKIAMVDDPKEGAGLFLKYWEGIPLASEYAHRQPNAQKIYEYMKDNGMDGKADKDKINKKIKANGKLTINTSFDATSSEGSSSVDNECGIEVEDESSKNETIQDFGGGWTDQPFAGSKVPVSSPYGPRDLAGSPWHDGVDWGFASLGSGRDIIAVHNGKIQYAGSPAKYGQPTGLPYGLGNYVIILSTGKYEVIYQEFAMDGGKSKVKTGDTVKAGQVIYEKAKQAPPVDHLHLSIIKGSGDDWSKAQADWQNPNSKYFINPAKVLGKKENGEDKEESSSDNKDKEKEKDK